jgi:hypothetical protein
MKQNTSKNTFLTMIYIIFTKYRIYIRHLKKIMHEMVNFHSKTSLNVKWDDSPHFIYPWRFCGLYFRYKTRFCYYPLNY